MPDMHFNINHYVRVRLTDYGRDVHRSNYAQLTAAYGGTLPYAYVPPTEDAEGWSRWQAWDLMREFGNHIHMGGDLPFETAVVFEVE